MPIDGGGGFRAGDHDHPPPMRHARAAIVDPLPSAMHHGLTDAVDADPAVVVAPNRKHRRDLVELANQLTQLGQLGATVHQVAPEQHYIRIAASHGIEYLPAQQVGTTIPEVNVADIQESIRVVPRRESFLADVQVATQPDLQRSAKQGPSRARELLDTGAFGSMNYPE